jgi:hypothetical protein
VVGLPTAAHSPALSFDLNPERPLVRTNQPCWLALSVYSPLSVLREYVVAVLHHRVAREPALRVVLLRRIVRYGGGPKRIGRRVMLERAPPRPDANRGRLGSAVIVRQHKASRADHCSGRKYHRQRPSPFTHRGNSRRGNNASQQKAEEKIQRSLQSNVIAAHQRVAA